MKKYISILVSIICVLTMLCACSNEKAPADEGNLNQIVNPITECTVDDIATGLGLKGILLNGVDSTCIIDSTPTIFNIELTKDSVGYTIRLAKADNEESVDISGVYFGEDLKEAIYDSADADQAPTVVAKTDNEYSQAYCNWNGYHFSVSSNQYVSLDDIQKTTVDYAKVLISKDNIK